MKRVGIGAALAAASLLAACDGDTGDLGGNRLAEKADADASAEGKAEEGRISMKGPGFDFALNIPGGIADHADVEGDSKIVYPGATISGMHIAAGEGGGRGGVELRFTSRDPVEKILSWYRDPARSDAFTIASAEREGDAFLIAGATRDDGNDFKLRLDSKDGSGTEGRLTLSERS